MDEIFVSYKVFFVSLMSSLLSYTTLIHYQNRSEEGSLDMTLVFALVLVTCIG